MNFKIHRGTNEIGGTCVEVRTETSRLVIDMGLPLVNPDKTPFDTKTVENRSRDELIKVGILPDIPSLYEDSSKTALLISHAHQDHFGLINHVNPSIPIWLGFGTQLLIELTNTFTGKEWKIGNAKHIKNGKKFKICDIEVIPYRMDHAAFDSYSFLIEANGKSLFYSGDFRFHGRKSKDFEWFCQDIKKPVDYLLLEGTTINRDEQFSTEEELEEQFVKTFEKTKGINLVFASGQNIDRIKTIYKACGRAKKLFLIDFYVANVLKTLNKKADNTIPFPSRENYPDIRVYYPYRLTDLMSKRGKKAETVFPFTVHKLSKNEIDKMANQLVMVVRPSVQRDLELKLHNFTDGCFIYSMWGGYKNKPGKIKDFLDFISEKGMPIKDIHTSGHADFAGLLRLVKAVNPRHIVPIHTFDGDSYGELFEGYNIVRAKDKETINA